MLQTVCTVKHGGARFHTFQVAPVLGLRTTEIKKDARRTLEFYAHLCY
jgi:hypothetical protein